MLTVCDAIVVGLMNQVQISGLIRDHSMKIETASRNLERDDQPAPSSLLHRHFLRQRMKNCLKDEPSGCR